MTASRAAVVSSFTVIKGSLIEPSLLALRAWDLDKSPGANLSAVHAANANWSRDLRKVLHRRFDPAGRDRALVDLAKAGCPLEVWKPILLWHITRDEFLLREFLVDWLYRQHAEGAWRLKAADVLPWLAGLHERSDIAIKGSWSASTSGRVASGLLRFACDFGLMTGTVVREFASFHLPDDAFLYLLHAVAERARGGLRVVEAPDWRMFLLCREDVERELYRLHQFRRLHYAVAGDVAELRLPCPTAAAFAREIAR